MGQLHKMRCYLSLCLTRERYDLQSPVNSHHYLKSHLKSYLGCWQLIRLPALDYSTQTLGEYQYFVLYLQLLKQGFSKNLGICTNTYLKILRPHFCSIKYSLSCNAFSEPGSIVLNYHRLRLVQLHESIELLCVATGLFFNHSF